MRAGTILGTRADRGLGPDPRHFRLTPRQVEVLAEFEAAYLSGEDTPRVRDLARRFGVTIGAIAWRLRALVGKGWLVPPSGVGHRHELSEAAIAHLHSYEPEITSWIPRQPRHA